MERAFAELVRSIHVHHDVVVVARDLEPELRPLVRWRRVRVPNRPGPLKQVFFFLAAGVALRREAADVVHTMGAVVLNRASLRSVHMCHAGFREKTGSFAPPGAPRLRRVNRACSHLIALAAERWCYRPGRTSLLAAVSGGLEVELRRYYPEVGVRLTPNGIDLDRFRPRDWPRQELRAALEVAPKAVVVVFAGGEWDHKGLEIAIRGLAAARAVPAQGPSRPVLWVVGRGDQARFERLAASLGVAGHVRFLGFRPDLERCFQAADVFLLPSLYETFSLVTHEAAACGLPVVATRVSGVEDLVGDGGAGILVDRDSASVADALVRLADDPSLRARLGAEARRRCLELTWEHSAGAVARLYRELARPSSAGPGVAP